MGRRTRLSGRTLLVDAHNVLHQDPRWRSQMLDDPEPARHALLACLRHRAATHCFFDGGPGGVATSQRHGRCTAHYSGGGSADDALIAWLDAHPDSAASVVSDDRELRARARARGARLLPAQGFLDRFADHDAAEAQDPDRQPPTGAELDYWMRIFGADED